MASVFVATLSIVWLIRGRRPVTEINHLLIHLVTHGNFAVVSLDFDHTHGHAFCDAAWTWGR